MSLHLDELESEALDAKEEVAFRRSKYPSICANWLQKALKSDIKTSMEFKVTTGSKTTVRSRYEDNEECDKLGLQRNITISYKHVENLEGKVNQISKALDLVSKFKKTH